MPTARTSPSSILHRQARRRVGETAARRVPPRRRLSRANILFVVLPSRDAGRSDSNVTGLSETPGSRDRHGCCALLPAAVCELWWGDVEVLKPAEQHKTAAEPTRRPWARGSTLPFSHSPPHPSPLTYKFTCCRCRTPVPAVCSATPKHVRSSGSMFSTAADTLQVTSATSVASNARAAPWTRAAARTVPNSMSDALTLGHPEEAQALCIPRRPLPRSRRRLQTPYRLVIQPNARLRLSLVRWELIVGDPIAAKRPAPQPREPGLSPSPQPGKASREPPPLS